MKEHEEIKNKILWCIKQKKGIKIENPNNNLYEAYIKKAKSSLNMLGSAIEKNEIEWISTTSYYAKYFSLYALLQKIGIRSEIQDCTILLMKYIFVDENVISEGLYKDLIISKKIRVELQYYSVEDNKIKRLRETTQNTGNFVLKIEQISESLDFDRINRLREKIKILFS